MSIPPGVHCPRSQHAGSDCFLDALLHPAVMVFEPLAAPYKIFAVDNIVEIDLGGQLTLAVPCIGGFTRGTEAERSMIVAVKGEAVHAVVGDQFGANVDEVFAPRPIIAA